MENGQESKPLSQTTKDLSLGTFFFFLASRVGRLEAINFQQQIPYIPPLHNFGTRWSENAILQVLEHLNVFWLLKGRDSEARGEEAHSTFRTSRTKYLQIYSLDGMSADAKKPPKFRLLVPTMQIDGLQENLELFEVDF